jgi:hypothetical protein
MAIGLLVSPVLALPVYAPGQEVIEKRTENSKTTYLGKTGKADKYAVNISMGAVHYKDNYFDEREQWKDIDLTFVNGKITKAPYELTVDGNSITVRDKKTNSIVALTLSEVGTKSISKPNLVFSKGLATAQNIAVDTDLEIVADNTRVRFTRVLKSDKAPAESKFGLAQVGSGIQVNYKAVDSVKSKAIKVNTSLKDGILIESIDTTGLTYPVRIDPTLDISVITSTDDVRAPIWNTGSLTLSVGNGFIANNFDIYSGIRFINVTVPKDAAILTSYITLTSSGSDASAVVNANIYGENYDNTATYSTDADYLGRALTASVAWNAVGAWVDGTQYATPSLNAPIATITSRAGWASGNAMAFQLRNNGSTAGANTLRSAYSWDADPGKAAILHIEYIATGVVSTLDALPIAVTAATLNGVVTNTGGSTIDYYGFVWDTTDKGDGGNNDPSGPPGTWTNGWKSAIGDYGTTPFNHGIVGLTANTTYFYRAAAHNTFGWAYGSAVSFKTIGTPVGNTLAASAISTTTARLNGTITDANGQLCDVQFGWDTVSHAAFADYPNKSTLISDTYNTGDLPYADVTTLTIGTLYHFRINITNDAGACLGGDLQFTTSASIGTPSNFTAIPGASTVSLAWAKGVGSNMSLVRFSSAAYPATTADGVIGYLGTGNSVQIAGLTPGTTYYFSLWGNTGGFYSAVVNVMTTTLAYDASSNSTTNLVIPTPDSTWTQTPNAAKVSTIPVIGGLVQANAVAYNQPVNYLWYFMWMLAAVGAGIVVYVKGNFNFVLAFSVMIGVIGVGVWWYNLIAGIVVVLLAVIGIGFALVGFRRAGT